MRDLLTLAFDNYHFYIWLVISAVPAVLYGVRESEKTGQTSAQRMSFWLLTATAALVWSNGLFLLYAHLPLLPILRMAVAALASAVLGIAIGPVCAGLVRRISSMIHKPFFSENVLFFALTAICGVHLTLMIPAKFEGWHAVSYVANYSMGFSSRFMIGSILRLFAGSFVSEKEIILFCYAWYLILIVLCSALLNWFYKSVPQQSKPAALFGIACLVACPGSFVALWGTAGYYGKLDYFGLIFSLLGVIAFRKFRSTPLRYLCLTFCACFAIAIYQGYVFLYYSILAVVMIEDCMREPESASDSRRMRIVYSLLSVAVTAVCFLCFQFISTLPFAGAEEMLAALRAHSDAQFEIDALQLEYFSPLRDAYDLVTNWIHDRLGRMKMLIELLFLSPLIYMMVCVITRYERKGKGIRRFFNGFDYSLLTILFILPQFLLNVDWGRWLVAMVINFAFLLGYRLYRGDAHLSALAEKLSDRLRRNPVPAVLVVLYLFFLPKLTIPIFIWTDFGFIWDFLGSHV